VLRTNGLSKKVKDNMEDIVVVEVIGQNCQLVASWPKEFEKKPDGVRNLRQ